MPKALGAKMKSTNGEILENPIPYRQLIGVLTYLIITRPYIGHIVHTISQFQQDQSTYKSCSIYNLIRQKH